MSVSPFAEVLSIVFGSCVVLGLTGKTIANIQITITQFLDPCLKMFRNVKASALADGHMEWFEAAYKDSKQWKAVRQHWMKLNGTVLA